MRKKLLNLIFIGLLVLSWFPVTSALTTSPTLPRATKLLSVQTLLNPDSSLNTHKGISDMIDLIGWRVRLDSTRGPILSRGGPVQTAPTADTWSYGLNGGVSALAVIGNNLCAGSTFTQTSVGTETNPNHIARYRGGGWTGLNNVAKYNTLTSIRSELAHTGSDQFVNALSVYGSSLYGGGANFSPIADNGGQT